MVKTWFENGQNLAITRAKNQAGGDSETIKLTKSRDARSGKDKKRTSPNEKGHRVTKVFKFHKNSKKKVSAHLRAS